MIGLTPGQMVSLVAHITPRMSANNGDVLRDLAIAGLGMVSLPTFCITRLLIRAC